MDENQSDLTLPDISEAEHLASNDENDHENGDQVIHCVYTANIKRNRRRERIVALCLHCLSKCRVCVCVLRNSEWNISLVDVRWPRIAMALAEQIFNVVANSAGWQFSCHNAHQLHSSSCSSAATEYFQNSLFQKRWNQHLFLAHSPFYIHHTTHHR